MEVAGISITVEEYQQHMEMVRKGRMNAALAVLLNSENGSKIFSLDGSLKGRVEKGIQKLKVWPQENVNKISKYFNEKFGLPEDSCLQLMKTWRKSKVKEQYRKNKAKVPTPSE